MKKLAVCFLLALASVSAAQPGSPAPVASIATHPIPSSYTDLGLAPSGLPAGRVLLYLARTPAQQAQLDLLVQEQADPASPEYHRYLTPAQFGRRFGPPDTALQAVTSWLAVSGFSGMRVLDSRIAIEFTATAPQLQAAFHTQIHAFAAQAGPANAIYGNSSPASIPADLAPYIKSVSLSNIGPRPQNHPLGTFALRPPAEGGTTVQAAPLQRPGVDPLYNITGYRPCAPAGLCYALVPGDVATIYNTRPVLAAGIDGAGITIGIAGVSNIDLPTVQRFRTLFLPRYSAGNLPNVILDGPDPGQENYGTDEAYIDVETAGSVAPNATINLYAAANSPYANGLTLALARAVGDNAISILSVSYGECEAYLGSSNSVYRDFYEEAAAQGITVVASSGDSGAAGCDPPPGTSVFGSYQGSYGLAVNGLASTPYNIAVGGTDFLYPASPTSATFNKYWNPGSSNAPANNVDWSSALSYIPEKPWADSDPILNQVINQAYAGGGGGRSSCAQNNGGYPATCQGGYPKPPWQQGFGNDQVRDLPDLSFFSGIGSNYSFYAFCTSHDYFSFTDCAVPNAGPNSTAAPIVISGYGGTSVATPLMAGILALVAQKTQTPRLGLATPVLYPLSQQFPAAFHDITSGTIAMACVAGSTDCGTNGFLTGYAAGPGFDLATGLGSVDANQLVTHWSSITPATLATSTTLALTPSSGPHETVVTFNVNVTGTSRNPQSGPIVIYSGATPVLLSVHDCAAFPCSFPYKGLPGGTYPVTVRFAGDGNFASSTSAPVTVSITPEPSEVLLLNAFHNNQQFPPNGLNGVTNVQLGQALGFLIAPAPLNTPAGTSYTAIDWSPPTGTLTITDRGVPVGAPIKIGGTGSFSFIATSFGLGPHSLTVQYSGDASYGPSDSASPLATPINFTVIKSTPSALDIYGLPYYGGAAVGDPIPLSLYLYGIAFRNNPNFPVPTGALSVTLNGTVLPPVSLASRNSNQSQGNITIPGNLIMLGNNTIQVDYPGDANYTAISTNQTFQGIFFGTYASLGSIPNTTSAGLPITFYLEISRDYQAIPSTIPSNVTITLLDGKTPFATVPLAPDIARQSADATYPYAGLSVGTHTITLQYAGDAGDLPSSATATIVITPGVPGVTLSATPVTFAAGLSAPSATSTLTVTPINGFTGLLALSCSGIAFPGGSCSIPSTVSLAGTSPATVSVTIATTGKTAQLLAPTPFHPPWLPSAVACLLLGFTLTRTRRHSTWRAFSTLLLAAILLANVIACGSGNFQNSPPGSTVNPGSYSVTIVAASGAVRSTTNIPITVQ